MKRLLFEELLLLSQRERSARRIQFNPSSTVIKGANDTGKSSLIKSLYWTLGAEPPAIHPKWSGANVYASLRFSIDDQHYRMIRAGSRFCLFDEKDSLIGTYASVTNELGPKIAELFNFRLLLRSKGGEEAQATPAFLFLPFYLDQDAGWTKKLNSFSKLQQFSGPNRDVLYFHFGIRPSGYYTAKSRATEADIKSSPLRQERSAVEAVLRKLEKHLKLADFNIDPTVFKEEVELLLEQGETLRKEEEKQKRKMAQAYAVLSSVKDQIRITTAALNELREDHAFASGIPGDVVACPTCHAEYANGFAERFSIAVDEDNCLGMLRELDEELRSAETSYDQAAEGTEAARLLSAELTELLQGRREALRFADLVRSESRKETRRVLEDEIRELNEKVGEMDAQRESANAEMDSFKNKKRSDEILSMYRTEMDSLLDALDVRTLPPESYRKPEAPIKETGSDLPRALLAFYLASIRAISANSACALCPLVIDTPKQQDPDEASWARIRSAIHDRRPKDSQLILALADDVGTDFGGNVVELKQKYSLLQQSEYDDVRNELIPLYECALRAGLGEGEGD